MPDTFETLELELDATQEDETIFLPMADFLTLLSIAFIFVALQYGASPSIGNDSSVTVVRPSKSAVSVQYMDDSVVYVGLIPQGAGFLVRIVPPGSSPPLERSISISLSVDAEAEIIEWVVGQVEQLSGIETIVVDLSASEAPGSIYRLTVKLAGELRNSHAVQFSP